MGGFVLDSRVMYLIGSVFVLIAGLLTIRYMDLAAGWIVSLGLAALVIASEFFRGFIKGGTVALFSLAGLSSPLMFFLLQRDTPFYVATVMFFAFAIYLVVRTRSTWSQFNLRNSAKHAINLESAAVWFALIASSLAVSWATYFKFLTTLDDEYFLRRLAFSLFLLVIGVICTALGRKSLLPFWGVMGLTFIVAGVAKVVAYDTTHLHGLVRIGVFAGGGLVLLLGGVLTKKQSHASAQSA